MMLARDRNGAMIPAEPMAEAWCPECGDRLVAKCGAEVAWHFAHPSERPGCALWRGEQGEGRWHARWKADLARAGFALEQVVGGRHSGVHRADAWLLGQAVEIQHGWLPDSEVADREEFWGPGLVWILDMHRLGKELVLDGHGSRRFLRIQGSAIRPLVIRRRPVVMDTDHGLFLTGAWLRKEVARPDGTWWVFYEGSIEDEFTRERLVQRLVRRAEMFGPDGWDLAPARTLWLDRGWAAIARRRVAEVNA